MSNELSKEITVKIRFEEFNSEYHADLYLGEEKVNYLACDDLNLLMRNIKHLICNHYYTRGQKY